MLGRPLPNGARESEQNPQDGVPGGGRKQPTEHECTPYIRSHEVAWFRPRVGEGTPDHSGDCFRGLETAPFRHAVKRQ